MASRSSNNLTTQQMQGLTIHLGRRILLVVAMVLCTICEARASIIEEFRTDETGGGIVNDTFTIELLGLSDGGVTFDAELTVVGSADLHQSPTGTGMGVIGGDGNLVDDGESLRFSMAVSNVIGGSVVFDGFTKIDFNFLGDSDVAVLSLDNDETTEGDNFLEFLGNVDPEDVADISGTSPTAFSAFAKSGGSNSFRVDYVSGQFTGTAVPEPAGGLVLAIGCILTARYRKRKSPIAPRS